MTYTVTPDALPVITTTQTPFGRLIFEGKIVRGGDDYLEDETRIVIPGVKSTSILKRGDDNIVRVASPLSFYSEGVTIEVDFAPIRVKLGKLHALTMGDSQEIYFGRGLFFRYRGEFYFYVKNRSTILGVKIYHMVSRALVAIIPGVLFLFVVGDNLIGLAMNKILILRPRV